MELLKKKKTVEQERPSVAAMMNAWPDCFYNEGDAQIRRDLLDEADRQALTPEENALRRRLIDKRYVKVKKDGKMATADMYLRLWFSISFAGDSMRGDKIPKRSEKDIAKELKSLDITTLESEEEKALLYREFHHTATLYFSLSMGDKQYGSVILGFGRMSDQKVAQKIARDVAKVGCTVPELVRFTHYDIWQKALTDAYRDVFPDEADYLARLIRAGKEE